MCKKLVGCFFVCVGLFTSLVCIVYTAQNLYVERKPKGYLFWNNIILCEDSGTCFHELAHIKNDQLGYPSQSPEFRKAIDEYLEWCKSNKRFWPVECAHLESFPGINGNELNNRGWGGYEELYCDLFEKYIWNNWQLPENVKIFSNIHWREK